MKFRNFFAAVLAAAVCMTISSCGKPAAEPETASKIHVYKEDKIELADGFEVIDQIIYRNEKIYLLGEKYIYGEDDNFQSTSHILILNVINIDGELEKETELDFDIKNFFCTSPLYAWTMRALYLPLYGAIPMKALACTDFLPTEQCLKKSVLQTI